MKLFIGFDIQHSDIRLLLAAKGAAAQSARLHFTSRIFTDAFFQEATRLLDDFFEGIPSARHQPAFVVLPSAAVGLETFNLPNMSRARAQVALDTELKNLYEDRLKTKKINRFLLVQNKDYSIYGAIYFDKTLVSRIYKMLTDVKMIPRLTTYAGNALLDSALGMSARLRGKSFLFADVQKGNTVITLCSKGKTMGTTNLPHGYDILSEEEVFSEYMITDHVAAEIAVINAREAARAKALTQAGADTYAEEPAQTQAAEVAKSETAEDPDDEDFSEEGGLKAVEEGDAPAAEQEKVKSSKNKIYRKIPKRYPKFMTREVPQTPEGVLYENFRILLKWMLLYARQAETAEYLSKPEFIVVNLPPKYSHLTEQANEEQKQCGGLLLRPFVPAEKLPEQVRENLDLYGCTYAKHYNANHNY